MNNIIKTLDKYVSDKLLRKAVSKDGKLAQYNYTDKCAFDKAWDDITMNNRGHVYEVETGKLVARAFPKFFNLEQLDEITQTRYINNKEFTIAEKLDGCMGVLYFYNSEWILNSRGSFDSFASEAGKEILEKLNPKALNPACSYIFEIISPETKIIINYDETRLVLLGGYVTSTGVELSSDVLDLVATNNGFSRPETYTYTLEELLKIQKELGYDKEGFVIRLNNGERFKIKSFKYLEVARIKANCTVRAVWKKLKDEYTFNVETGFDVEKFKEEMSALPDEFYKEVLNYFYDLQDSARTVYEMCEIYFKHVVCSLILDVTVEEAINNPDKYAKAVGLSNIENKTLAFIMLKSMSIHKYIMDRIEPTEEGI